ncbi:hypothetical protein [Flaviaesturariibacter amylovorans]|uniref:Uncharacterized protein n=1 Tax=Flaviaesturariibacter amylovorans TaxID=1084520 RepID=A0ABP8GR37_9BACT
MITVDIPIPDAETKARLLAGCKHYGMSYHLLPGGATVRVMVLEHCAIDLFWLGANLARPQINTSLSKSAY